MRSKCESQFDINPLTAIEHGLLSIEDPCYVQDTTHIGTKLRNRILKVSILLPFGKKFISVSHLKMLLEIPKDKHGLVYKDVCPDDRQNYASLEKVMADRVLEALKQNVFDSEATIVFLKICKFVTSSYLNTQLKPTERVYRMWHATFVLRFWRNWIEKNSSYNLNENFISDNAYICVELNALNMLRLISKLRNAGKPEWFLPYLFDSQTCESTFRQMRSMGTINFTKINFTLLELFHLIERVELQNEIVYNRLAHTDIVFSRIKQRVQHDHVHDLPSNQELVDTLKTARDDAKNIAIEFGMYSESFDVERCPVKKIKVQKPRQKNQEFFLSDSEDDDNSFIFNEENKLNLREYSNEETILEENSKYIEVFYLDGSTQVVRKSSIVGLLSDSTKKLSSDRLKRVQDSGQDSQQSSKRIKLFGYATKSHNDQLIRKCEEIMVGEWCVFALDFDSSPFIDVPKESIIKNTIIGTVLAFQYHGGKTHKQKQYRKDTAAVSSDDLSVLSNWYAINTNGVLIPLKGSNSFYIPMNKYIATVKNVGNLNIIITEENLKILNEMVLEIVSM